VKVDELKKIVEEQEAKIEKEEEKEHSTLDSSEGIPFILYYLARSGKSTFGELAKAYSKGELEIKNEHVELWNRVILKRKEVKKKIYEIFLENYLNNEEKFKSDMKFLNKELGLNLKPNNLEDWVKWRSRFCDYIYLTVSFYLGRGIESKSINFEEDNRDVFFSLKPKDAEYLLLEEKLEKLESDEEFLGGYYGAD